MRWTLALLSLIALGCSNDPDALYAKGSHTADSGAPAAAMPAPVPQLPALPDKDRQADCEQCAKTTCSDARANCLEDDDCTDELRCKGGCSDPACLQACSAEFGWSSWYTDYANCVFGQCRTECNIGNNLQCRGKYDWPAATTSSFEVVFKFVTPPTLYLGNQPMYPVIGATVRACDDDRECDNLSSAQVGIDNQVKLALPAGTIAPKDFRGYLEIEGGSAGEHLRIFTTPLARSQKFFTGFVPSAYGPSALDSARPRVTAEVMDCLLAPIAGVRVTLPDMPEIPQYGSDISNTPTFSKGPTSQRGFAMLINLPDSAADSLLRVRAEWPDTQEKISERAIWVRPGFSAFVWLVPSARSD